jgi:hypothetical protein
MISKSEHSIIWGIKVISYPPAMIGVLIPARLIAETADNI